VPVPIHKRILGTGVDFEEMIEQRSTEQVALAVAEQETRKETYKALRDAGLPIPQDLLDDFRPKAALPQPGDQRPPESDEQRQGMAKPAALTPTLKQGSIVRKGIREATREHYVAPDNSEETNPQHHRPVGRFGNPRHIAMRRHVEIAEVDETA
jgi:hypothetical protein